MMGPIAVLLILLMATTASAATFLWPWQKNHHQRRTYGHHRVVDPKPDCDQIRAAIDVLEPKRLERALRSSNAKQRETITRCRAER